MGSHSKGKMMKKMKDGGQALFNALKAKGYKRMGGENLLVEMTMGGTADLVQAVVDKSKMDMMKKGGEDYYKMGGQTGRSTYSGKKKKKKK